ncbi:hypothetical protein ACFOEK_16605 [Litoribrevibacter euphylliae]|uniref:HAMP domain-containing protein n=1 Tax=Litoribrevibacter euphylliae TaxID=1834034 RepID=A0ABV7HFL4_9GAMM
MTIRSQLLISFLITSLLPLLLVMSIALYQGVSETHMLKRRAMVATIEHGAESINRFFTARIAELSMYSEHDDVRSMDFTKMRPFLMNKLEQHDTIYEKFIVGTPKGYFYNTAGGNPHVQGLRTFDDTSPKARPKHIRKRDYWKRIIGENKDQEALTYISNPMISYTTGVKQVVIASSIMDQDLELVGLLGGSLPWKTIHQLILETKAEILQEFPDNTRFMLISKNGTYWYHWDPERVIRIETDQGQAIKNDIGENQERIRNILKEPSVQLSNIGSKMLSGISGSDFIRDHRQNLDGYLFYAPIKNAGYSLAAYVEASVVHSASKALVYFYIVLTLVTILVIVSLWWYLSRQITQPLIQLNDTLEHQINQEDCSPIPINDPKEVENIKHSVNALLTKVRFLTSAKNQASQPHAPKEKPNDAETE